MGAPKDPTLLLEREAIIPNEMTTPAKGSGRTVSMSESAKSRFEA
jgi:hypothetical protein